MVKNGEDYADIYNYRNSRYFINSVMEARRKSNKDIVIFAGACQSFFEAIMAARSKFCLVSCKSVNRFYGSFDSSRKSCNN